MGEVGCYDLVLYCDHPECIDDYSVNRPNTLPFAEFNGFDRGDCVKEARNIGWLITRKRSGLAPGIGFCLCPKHSGKKVKYKKYEETVLGIASWKSDFIEQKVVRKRVGK